MMRLFISINFDEKTIKELIKVQRNLGKMGKGRFVPPENLHLTIAFLGEVPEEKLPLLSAALRTAEVPVMDLKIAGVGTFSEESGLFWAGLEGSRKLNALKDGIYAALEEIGFYAESDKFRPHVTLVRNYAKGRGFDARKALPKPIVFTVSSFSLMRSKLGEKGAVYTELERYTSSGEVLHKER